MYFIFLYLLTVSVIAACLVDARTLVRTNQPKPPRDFIRGFLFLFLILFLGLPVFIVHTVLEMSHVIFTRLLKSLITP